jgi:hypothetical protein
MEEQGLPWSHGVSFQLWTDCQSLSLRSLYNPFVLALAQSSLPKYVLYLIKIDDIPMHTILLRFPKQKTPLVIISPRLSLSPSLSFSLSLSPSTGLHSKPTSPRMPSSSKVSPKATPPP